MDMYQKRKKRKEMKNDENKKEMQNQMNINWYPGHMAKTKRQLIEELKLIDVVIEIVDARIPMSSRNPDILEITKNKKRVIILNKSDLANENENIKWQKYFKMNETNCCIVDSNSGKGINNVLTEVENLMSDELKRYEAKGRIGKPIRVAILGIPNVGKSSFINRIAKKSTMIVGNKPGVTKQNKWLRINSKIELLDTPGVLWPKFENKEVGLNLAFTGSIKDDILDKVEVAYYLIEKLYRDNKDALITRYKLEEKDIENMKNEPNEIYALFEVIAKKRGAILSGGRIDEEKAASIILDDFRSGKIGKITLERCNK